MANETSTISIEKTGRRYYLTGNTYPIKDALRSAGCKWDGDRKAWWTGKADVAERLASETSNQAAPDSRPQNERPGPSEDSVVAARATYKGRTYYIAGKTIRGRTIWDESVDVVSTRDGAKFLLYFRDGSKSFWAPRAEIQVAKSYNKPMTIGGLKRFAEKAKAGRCRECRTQLETWHDGYSAGLCHDCA